MSKAKLPKDTVGKPKMHLVPPSIMRGIAFVREYGNRKYGSPDNWKEVDPIDYVDAGMRHYLKILPDLFAIDEESGLPHLWQIACNVAFLCEKTYPELYKKYVDEQNRRANSVDCPSK